MMVHHVMLYNRNGVQAVTMNLVVFLMDGVVSPVVCYAVTDVVCGGGDGHVVVGCGHRGGAMVRWRRPQGGEQRQGGVRGDVVGWGEDVVVVQPRGRGQRISLVLH